jgi:hypothetical protein
MIKKYRKKPVVIEAVRYMTKNADEILEWADGAIKRRLFFNNILDIETLEGDVIAIHGDYIIKGIAGEFYPCKEPIFLESYESA